MQYDDWLVKSPTICSSAENFEITGSPHSHLLSEQPLEHNAGAEEPPHKQYVRNKAPSNHSASSRFASTACRRRSSRSPASSCLLQTRSGPAVTDSLDVCRPSWAGPVSRQTRPREPGLGVLRAPCLVGPGIVDGIFDASFSVRLHSSSTVV